MTGSSWKAEASAWASRGASARVALRTDNAAGMTCPPSAGINRTSASYRSRHLVAFQVEALNASLRLLRSPATWGNAGPHSASPRDLIKMSPLVQVQPGSWGSVTRCSGQVSDACRSARRAQLSESAGWTGYPARGTRLRTYLQSADTSGPQVRIPAVRMAVVREAVDGQSADRSGS
jgi:hypothetical protein